MRGNKFRIALNRIQIMQIFMRRKLVPGRRSGKAFVRDNDALRYAVFDDKVPIARDVEYVAGIALGAYGLHLFEIKSIKNRYVSCAFCSRFSRKFGKRINFGFV